jgi:hypothetical protein
MHRSSFCAGLLEDGADRIRLAVMPLIVRHVLNAAVHDDMDLPRAFAEESPLKNALFFDTSPGHPR